MLEMPLKWHVSGQIAANRFGNNLMELSANIVLVSDGTHRIYSANRRYSDRCGSNCRSRAVHPVNRLEMLKASLNGCELLCEFD